MALTLMGKQCMWRYRGGMPRRLSTTRLTSRPVVIVEPQSAGFILFSEQSLAVV